MMNATVHLGADHNYSAVRYRANRDLSPFTRWEIA